jgi:hypothetical protein
MATLVKWESGLLESIHAGKPGPSGELCLAQLHRSIVNVPHADYAITRAEWLATPGLDSTRHCIDIALRVIRWHVYRCNRYRDDFWDVSNIFAEYHHPTTFCESKVLPMSKKRKKSYDQMKKKILAVMPED